MSGILVLGGTGMLGHKMFQVLRNRFPGTRCTITGACLSGHLAGSDLFPDGSVEFGFDVMDADSWRSCLKATEPEVVVNCIGVIKQRDMAHDPVPCLKVNALFPHELLELCADWGGRVIHFSTDCVFSGRDGRYTEDSVSDAEDLYGRTKYLGEVRTKPGLTLRTSIIGHELKTHASLLDWFLSQKDTVVQGYAGVMYSGVTTNYLARVVADLIADHPRLSGLYQVAGPAISKADLLTLVKEAYGLAVTIEPRDEPVSDRTLDGRKFVTATGIETPSWQSMIQELAVEYPRYESWRT